MFEHMSWGKKNRLSSIVAPDGRALMLAIDHGYFMGATHGMEKPAEAIEKLLPHVDSLMLSPGILSTCIDPALTQGVSCARRQQHSRPRHRRRRADPHAAQVA